MAPYRLVSTVAAGAADTLTKESEVQEFLQQWGYLGVFLAIVGTGLGLPIPEELPVVIGGGLAGGGSARWWIMLPVAIVAVIIGDSFLYLIGRFYGPRLLQYRWVRTRLLPADRLQKIENNFQKYGVRILLFARLTPGIRAPIFLTAGLTKLSMARFLLADGIYAIPGVTLLFFLGYWFAEAMVGIIEDIAHFKNTLILVAIGLVGLYVLYRFLRRPVVTGSPKEMPKAMAKIERGVEKVVNTVEDVATMIIHPQKTGTFQVRRDEKGDQPPPDGEAPRPEAPQPEQAQEPGTPPRT